MLNSKRFCILVIAVFTKTTALKFSGKRGCDGTNHRWLCAVGLGPTADVTFGLFAGGNGLSVTLTFRALPLAAIVGAALIDIVLSIPLPGLFPFL